tara:strand:- start:9331 stop:10740 length:1410 start_codon:yes stop_codon:yes gene_type:complete
MGYSTDNTLINLAYQLRQSELAQPEVSNPWEIVEKDIKKWQKNSQERAEKFIDNLPEQFNLQKIEPNGRKAVGAWYKNMRSRYTDAANSTSWFSPGSDAYTEGTATLNSLEDEMNTVSGILDNIKVMRTNAIENKDMLATGVSEDQKALNNALISGEIFDDMEIKNGEVYFKVNGKKIAGSEFKPARVQENMAEDTWNGILAATEENKQKGFKFNKELNNQNIYKMLELGNKSGESFDMMFSVKNKTKNGISFIDQYLSGNPVDKWNTEEKIKNDYRNFFFENKRDFGGFLMETLEHVDNNTDLDEKTRQALLKEEANIRKINNDAKKLDLYNAQLKKQQDLAVVNLGQDKTFRYGDKIITKNPGKDDDGYSILLDNGTQVFATDIDDLIAQINLPLDSEEYNKIIEAQHIRRYSVFKKANSDLDDDSIENLIETSGGDRNFWNQFTDWWKKPKGGGEFNFNSEKNLNE